MNELILTDEQKRFWSQENWENLRWNGKEVNIQAVYITLNNIPHLPVYMRFCDENTHIRDAYFSLDGGYVITEVKPKQMVPWGKKEFIEHRNCLFRMPKRTEIEGKEVWMNGFNEIYEDGIKWDERCDLYPFDEFYDDGVEYSPDDGATWLPCMKEVTE
mgnify:CR=1 FL=1